MNLLQEPHSRAKTCQAYLKLVNLLKYATDQEITVKEASLRISNTYSSRTLRSTPSPPPQTQNTVVIDQMIAGIRILQAEFNSLKVVTIEDLQIKVENITTNVTKTKKKIDKVEGKFEKRFNEFERLLLARLPQTKMQNDISNQDFDSSMSSALSNKTSKSSSQIQARVNYAPSEKNG